MRVRPTRWQDQTTGRLVAVIPGPTLIVERNRIAEFKEVAALMPDDPVLRLGLAGATWMPGNRRRPCSNTRRPSGSNPPTRWRIVGSVARWSRQGAWPRLTAADAAGLEVAARTGDVLTKKEIEVFLHRLEKRGD
jgi:hypothetical protein